MYLTEEEFKYLLALEKRFEDSEGLSVGSGTWSRDILAVQTKDMFILDYRRASIEFKKFTFNKRYRNSIILLRYDALGRHTNPDGQTFEGAHVHIYKEGYNDKFAYPVGAIGLKEDQVNAEDILMQFLKYCNVNDVPNIQSSLL